MKHYNLSLLLLLGIAFVSCKKESLHPTPKEDLSYLIKTYSREERSNQHSQETIITYNGYKQTSYKHFIDGRLHAEYQDITYDELCFNCNVLIFSENNEIVTNQHFNIEYTDTTYTRSKHSINKVESETSNSDAVYETFNEYDGKRRMSRKRFRNGILISENTDYKYDSLSCSYTMKEYSLNGDLVSSSNYEIQYLDDTFLREKVTRYTTEYVDGSPTTKYFKSVQYDGKKQIGYRVFVDGKLKEEGRDYNYNGLKCNYYVDRYQDGVFSYSISFEEQYLE